MQEIPLHIAIIPDGNRRWAKSQGLPSLAGHKKGFDRTIGIIEHALELGVKVLTFYAFSTENWNRSKKEVDYLMELFNQFFERYIDKFDKMGCRFRHLGSYDHLSETSMETLKKAENITAHNSKMILQLALNYGGRDEICRTVKKLIENKTKGDEITGKLIADNLDTAGVPDPDLIIRTSGEQRVSGFLLWQAAYSELIFCDKFWPDFTNRELDRAIEEYQARQRRFGK